MFDQLIGLLLVGLGLKNPMRGTVAGESSDTVATRSGQKPKYSTSFGKQSASGSARFALPRLDIELLKEKLATGPADGKKRGKSAGSPPTAGRPTAGATGSAGADDAEVEEENEDKVNKDKRLKAKMQEIVIKMAEANKKRTEKMLLLLSKIATVLETLSARTSALSAQGVDVTVVEDLITEAREAIVKAQKHVREQAAKTFTLSDNPSDWTKDAVGRLRSALEQDLRVTNQSVIDARAMIGAAVKAFAALNKGEHE